MNIGLDPAEAFSILTGSAALSLALTASVRRYTLHKGLLDRPNDRSSHTTPTPRGGGIAIVLLTIDGVAIFCQITPLTITYIATAAAIAVISAVDDVRHVRASVRLFVHAAAGTVLASVAGPLVTITLPYFGELRLGILAFPLTVSWLIAVTNAYNFMDGIDGIAGGEAVVAGTAWAVIGIRTGSPLLSSIGLITAGSSAGFLILNWHPAKIFMGDVGSVFLGFTFAALPFLPRCHDGDRFVCGVLILWPFLFDTAYTLVARASRRENIFAAHRSHLYQRLARATGSHTEATMVYVALAAGGALGACFDMQPVTMTIAVASAACLLRGGVTHAERLV